MSTAQDTQEDAAILRAAQIDREIIWADIETRCRANDLRWGVRRTLTFGLWHAVLAEEVGEVAHEITCLNEANADLLRAELIDTAAVIIPMIEALDGGRFPKDTPPISDYALGSLLLIGDAYGTYARFVTERRSRQEVGEALSALLALIDREYLMTFRRSYAPRALQDEGDTRNHRPDPTP